MIDIDSTICDVACKDKCGCTPCDYESVSSAGAVMIDGHEVDTARVREVCERYGLVELAVFGSQSRGDAGPESDVDLFYVLAPGTHVGFALNELEDDLAGLFGHRVDLVSKKFLHPLLRDKVFEQAIMLYEV